MIPASHIKRTIDFNAQFRKLLEVLKLVAVSQYYVLERNLKTFEKLPEVLAGFFDSIDMSLIHHPFISESDKPLGVVALTSDAGLLGGMNNRVMTHAMDLVMQHQGRLIVIGEKGQLFAQDARVPSVFFPGINDAQRYRQALEIRDYLTLKVVQGALGPVKVVYPRAVTFTVHRVEVETLIPFARPVSSDQTLEKVVHKSGLARQMASFDKEAVIFESSPEEVIEYLVYICLGQRLYEIFGLSRLAEQAARFTHLEESCQKILDMNKKLYLQYFRRRHEMIDQNMRELFASRSIYAKS